MLSARAFVRACLCAYVYVSGGGGGGRGRAGEGGGELHAHLYNTPVVLSPPPLTVPAPSPLTLPILNCSNEQIKCGIVMFSRARLLACLLFLS